MGYGKAGGMGKGYFTDHSMLRIVHRERALALWGPRALLMQGAHPLAVEGLFAHTTALDNPYDRLMRTAETMAVVGFGTREEADRITAHVRRMHAKVRGTLTEPVGKYPAGTEYRADQPDLLMWVLFTLVDSGIVLYKKYVRGMSRVEEAAYWEDCKIVGQLFGLQRDEMPDTLEDLDDYRREMLEGDTLLVTDCAREKALDIVLSPPAPWIARPLVETANFIVIGTLPDRIRRDYGFSRIPPAPVHKAFVAGNAAYVKRAVVPFLPSRLRLIPSARLAA